MKKKAYLILSLFLLIFINECGGYKPIFSTTNLQFKISDHLIEGNQVLGKKIYSKLYSLSKSSKDNQSVRNIDIFINVSKEKKGTVKDGAGKILEYKITLNTEIRVKDFLTNEEILNNTITLSTNYNVQDQYSETVKLENKSTEIIIENIYQELLVKLSQSI